jgi:hypothetical protein
MLLVNLPVGGMQLLYQHVGGIRYRYCSYVPSLHDGSMVLPLPLSMKVSCMSFLLVFSMQILYPPTVSGIMHPYPCSIFGGMLLLYSLQTPLDGMLFQPPPLTTWHAAPLSSLPTWGSTGMLLVYLIPTWWRHTVPLTSPYL